MSNAKKYTVEAYGPQIETFLGDLIAKAGLELSFVVSPGTSLHPEIENPELMVKFSGRDVDMVLENRAELMLALEHLTLELLRVPSDEHSLICFDANDYRVLRMEELRLSALAAAERVKKTGEAFRFSPMTSRERRIVHMALREEKELTSESFGTGPTRQVVIYLANGPKPNIPLLPPPPPRRPFGAPATERAPRDDRRGGGRDRGPRRGPRPRRDE
jgi:spoIIIJ-associated protein